MGCGDRAWASWGSHSSAPTCRARNISTGALSNRDLGLVFSISALAVGGGQGCLQLATPSCSPWNVPSLLEECGVI